MEDLAQLKRLATYCGAFCGECGIYKGRVYAMVSQDFREIIEAAGYSDWLPRFVKLDFDFEDFLKGVEYFSKEDSECYCQEPCKKGGGAPCEIRPCAKEKGIEICYECKEFPCEKLSWILEKHSDRLEDYERFKKLGWAEWMKFHLKRAVKGYAVATRKYYGRAWTE